jgi:reactive intermediate/imine deaminase
MQPVNTGIVPIRTTLVPKPAGHYEQGVRWDDLIFVSGQLPVLPNGTHAVGSPFEQQVRQALTNMLAVVREAGSDPSGLLKVTAYLVGVENWPAFNAVYAEVLPDWRPARTVVPVPALHHGYLVEIDAVAVRRAAGHAAR